MEKTVDLPAETLARIEKEAEAALKKIEGSNLNLWPIAPNEEERKYWMSVWITGASAEAKRARWITVREWLPKKDQEVNCWNGEKVVAATFRTDDAGFGFAVQKYSSSDDRDIVAYWTDVTHWQPLPEPPSGLTS